MAQLAVLFDLNEAQAGNPADTGFSDKISRVVEDRDAVAQVDTVTVGGATNVTIYGITVNGIRITYTSDASATVTEIVDGLVAAAVANSFFTAIVTAVDADPDIVLTAAVAGTALTVAVDDEATGDLSVVNTTPNVAAPDDVPFGAAVFQGSDFGKVILPDGAGTFEGVAMLQQVVPIPNAEEDAQLNAGGDPVYKPTKTLPLMRKGRVYVESEVTPAPGDPVRVRHTATAGTTRGKFTTVVDANTQAVAEARWVGLAPNASLEILELNLP